MNVCALCLREMACVKTGLIVRFRNEHCYSGDHFRCAGCGASVVICNSRPFYSSIDVACQEQAVLDIPDQYEKAMGKKLR